MQPRRDHCTTHNGPARQRRAAAAAAFLAALLLSGAAPGGDAHGTLNLPESRNGAQAGLGLAQGGRTQPYSVVSQRARCHA